MIALGVDAPLRVLLLAVGVVWAMRGRHGVSVVVIGCVFATLALLLTLLSGVPAVKQFYAITYPWGMHYRLLMVSSICVALLAGCGAVVALRWLFGFIARRSGGGWLRVGRLLRVLIVTWGLLTLWGLVLSLAYPTELVLGFSAAD